MPTMIKLKLPAAATFEAARSLAGLAGVKLDARKGLVNIDPRAGLYVVFAEGGVDDLDRRRQQSPEILGTYGDVKVSTAAPAAPSQSPPPAPKGKSARAARPRKP